MRDSTQPCPTPLSISVHPLLSSPFLTTAFCSQYKSVNILRCAISTPNYINLYIIRSCCMYSVKSLLKVHKTNQEVLLFFDCPFHYPSQHKSSVSCVHSFPKTKLHIFHRFFHFSLPLFISRQNPLNHSLPKFIQSPTNSQLKPDRIYLKPSM